MLTFRIHTKPVLNTFGDMVTVERQLLGYMTTNGEVVLVKPINQFEYDLLIEKDLLSDVTKSYLAPDKRATEKMEMVKV